VIFITVGSMFPFDRLIAAMDGWAAQQGLAEDAFLAQIGDGSFEPRHMRWVRRIDRAEFSGIVAGAELVVAHAGMGSVITAGEFGKPIVLLPRRAASGEHTNDHQVDTAGWLRRRPGIYVADTEADLGAGIAAARAAGGAAETLGTRAPEDFLARLRSFAEG
jgi:UDP-N-acetylglucosamine transferase subunit ALG13